MSSDAEILSASFFALLSDAWDRWNGTQVREPADTDELMDWYLGVLEAGA